MSADPSRIVRPLLGLEKGKKKNKKGMKIKVERSRTNLIMETKVREKEIQPTGRQLFVDGLGNPAAVVLVVDSGRRRRGRRVTAAAVRRRDVVRLLLLLLAVHQTNAANAGEGTDRVATAVSHVPPVAQQRVSGAVARRSRLEQHVLHLSVIKHKKKDKENVNNKTR